MIEVKSRCLILTTLYNGKAHTPVVVYSNRAYAQCYRKKLTTTHIDLLNILLMHFYDRPRNTLFLFRALKASIEKLPAPVSINEPRPAIYNKFIS